MNNSVLLGSVEIGEHFYWVFGNFHVHGQVILTSLLVFSLVCLFVLQSKNSIKPKKSESTTIAWVQEFFYEFVCSIANTQIGPKNAKSWVSLIATFFLFIFFSNWLGALIPWRLIALPHGELGAPTNDINTTTGLALLTSVAYFFAGINKKGFFSYFYDYLEPTPILLPIHIIEDFTKPLSLSFRLFGNILADELVIAVLLAIVPILIPIPLIFLGLFTSAIQALIFATLSSAYIGEAMSGH